jgi:hypothetical protein
MTGMATAAKRTQAARAAAKAHRIRVFIPMKILSLGAARGFTLILSDKLVENIEAGCSQAEILAKMS